MDLAALAQASGVNDDEPIGMDFDGGHDTSAQRTGSGLVLNIKKYENTSVVGMSRSASAGAPAPRSDCQSCQALLAENKALKDEMNALLAGMNALSSPKRSKSGAAPIHHRPTSSVLPDGREVRIAPEELAAMRAFFSLFSSDGKVIRAADLRALHEKLGEPITEEEANDAVNTIGMGSEVIDFPSFATYWDGSHPSLRKALERGTSVEAITEERDRKRRWYQAKFKFMKAKIPNPAIGRVFVESRGACPSLEYRLFFFYDGGAELGKVEISPWHDIPHKNEDGTFNMIVEIPKWSRRKFEIATGEPYNPIKQDVKNGVLREYAWGDMIFNYGAMPQTWENPKHISPDTGCGGDNDPLDLIEIGTKMWSTGSVVRVKILGVLGLIDAGETDWKVICISAEDPIAPYIDDIGDVEAYMPGSIEAVTRWLRFYKAPVVNEFAFGGACMGHEYALSIVDSCHKMWDGLVDERAEPSEGTSIISAGLRRSTSNAALAHIFLPTGTNPGLESKASSDSGFGQHAQ